MKLRHISLENLKRRKSKMIFMIIGMVIGIATVVTIFQITSVMQMDVEKKLDEFGANIMIVPKSNTLAMSYGGMSIAGASYDLQEIHEEELSKIWTIENAANLSTVSSKLLGAVEIDGAIVMLVGADLTTEIKLKKWWKFTAESNIEMTRVERPSPIDPTRTVIDTAIKDLGPKDVLIGYNVAEKFGILPGKNVSLTRNKNSARVSVKGILQATGSQDDSIIFMDLKAAQELLGKNGKITLVEVAALCAGCPVEELASQINIALPAGHATPIKQVVEQKMQTVNQLSAFGFIVGIVILIIGSLIVFTTMMSSVNERTREIGIFRAIGFRRSHIMRIILLEAVILSLIAGVLGYLLGFGTTLIVGPILTKESIGFPFNLYLALGSLGLALVTGTLATLFPARKASNIDPVEALRHI